MRLRFRNSTLNEKTFLMLQLIISTLIIFLTITNKQSLVSILFTLSFINLLLLYLSSDKRKNNTASGGVLLIFCVIAIIFSYMTGNKVFVLADLISFATFAASILFIQVACNIEVTKKLAHSVLLIFMISAALYPIGFNYLNANEFRTMGLRLLTMHFSSPNLAGMYLAQACLCSILCFFLTRKSLVKIIAIIIFAYDFNLLYLTFARNSLLAVILVLAGIAFISIKKVTYIRPIVIFFVAVFPLMFAIVYIVYIDAIGARGRFDFLVEEGKDLTSRVLIWKNVFQTLKGFHWLFGDFSKLRGNLHNSHLTVLGSYGAIGLVLFIKFLTDVMKHINKLSYSTKQVICLVCFFGTIFMGNGESALVYGSTGLYAIACSYLILARYDWENEH